MSTLVSRHRFVAVLVICLSGTALLPFASLTTGSFNWQAFADVYNVFANSFDSEGPVGELPWSSVYPPERMQFNSTSDPDQVNSSYQIDQTVAQALTEEPTDILIGVNPSRDIVFALEARQIADQYQIRIRAIEDNGAWTNSEWHPLADLATPFQVDWIRALQSTRDGSLYLSQHDELLAWVVDLDNDQAVAVEIGIREFSGQPILRQTLRPQ